MKLPVELLQAVRANRLLLFVGSGASSNAGLPMWHELAADLWAEFGDGDEPDEPIEILNRLASNERIVRTRIRERLGRRVEGTRLLVQRLLWPISEQIVTTNYDTLLERVGPGAHVCFTHNDRHALQSVTDQDSFIFKLHGSIERIEDCVVFPQDYHRLYATDGLAMIRLRALLTNRVVLFVGFSGADPFMRPLFRFLRSLGGKWKAPSYAITTDPDAVSPEVAFPVPLARWSELPGLLTRLGELRSDAGTRVFFIRSRRDTDRYLVPDLYRRRCRVIVGFPSEIPIIHVAVLTREDFRREAVDLTVLPAEMRGFAEGICAERRGLLEESETLLQERVPGHQLDLSRRLFLAIVLEKLGRTEEALDLLFNVLRESRHPTLTISAQFNAAVCLEKSGRFELAHFELFLRSRIRLTGATRLKDLARSMIVVRAARTGTTPAINRALRASLVYEAKRNPLGFAKNVFNLVLALRGPLDREARDAILATISPIGTSGRLSQIVSAVGEQAGEELIEALQEVRREISVFGAGTNAL